jgi:hypothetical protein
MSIARTPRIVARFSLALACLQVVGTLPLRAATIETETIAPWTLNAYASDKTGAFQSCSMKSVGTDQVSLTLSANAHNRWFLWLYSAKWDLKLDTRFIATLNLDHDRRAPIALDAKVANEHFISLALPPAPRVLDLLSTATLARVSREGKAYTFSLAGYDKAVQWMKSCVVRNNALEALKPDGRVQAEENGDNDAAGIEIRKARPSEPPKAAPQQPAEIIEIKADSPRPTPAAPSEPSLIQPAPTAPPSVSADAKPAAAAGTPAPTGLAALSPAALSDAARASNPIGTDPTAPSVGKRLLPDLMAAAHRSDFSVLDASAAPAPLKRADVVFRLDGLTGAILALDVPTPAAATNEILAYDRIACAGSYNVTTAPPESGISDRMLAQSECVTDGTSTLAQFMTVARKSGGCVVIALTAETNAGATAVAASRLASAGRALSDAADKLTGKF